jgi:3-hydroxyisobutyrate dehydrogenase-like beta-hydroxyacid dehydrogenase
MTQQEKPHIGYIGMGSMGSLMARRLLQAGYRLTVYDRTREKTREAEQNGAQVADYPRDLATKADVVMSCVTDYEALSDLMEGNEGALAGARAETVFIDMSTIGPEQSRDLHEKVKARRATMLDAAVSGSTPQAQDGSLVIFVGGEQRVFQQHKPILEHLGKEIFYMGESGKGTTMKMVVNTLLGLEMQAIAEAVTLGEKAGLEQNQLLDVLGQTTVIAPAHKNKLNNLKKGEYPTQFALSLMHKDFGLIAQMAQSLNVAMPATVVAQQMYASALARHGDADFSVMLAYMRDLAGLSEK